MKKPKYYLKPFWMVASNKDSIQVLGILKDTYNRIRLENKKPTLEANGQQYTVPDSDDDIRCWHLTRRVLTQRFDMER